MQARLETALDHHRAGRLALAVAGYRDVLAGDRDNVTAEAMLGVALAQSGAAVDSIAHLRRAVALAPGEPSLHENRGACLDQLGRRAEAATAYLRAAAVTAGAAALAAAGAALMESAQPRCGFRLLRRALATSPAEREWWWAGGLAALRAGDAGAAVRACRRAMALGLVTTELLGRLGDALLALDRGDEAAGAYEELMARSRASRWYRPELAAGAGPATGQDTFLVTSEPKLRHDIQQLDYLIGRGILPPSFAETAERYRRLHAASHGRATDGPCFFMSEAEWRSVEDTYNRVLTLYRPAPVAKALNATADWTGAEARYAASYPGIVVIDGLLAPAAMTEVRRLCLESTFWFDDRHLGGYLGAMLRDGLYSPLLLQIAGELRRRLPSIFSGHPLRQMWAYKYDSRLVGTGLHADAAAVNVNFWVTPDEANVSNGKGGLIVFDKKAPAAWDFEKYNNDQPAIRQFLAETGARSVTVPYRCNRAVIFHSDLFHRTDDLAFRDDYESRRINITMLFGDRGGAA
jgi:Flp pilus assembly protein TadD